MEHDSLANGKGAASLEGKRTIHTERRRADTIFGKEF